LTKAAAHLLGLGITHLLFSWELVALILAGALGMLLAQSAFQAGSLDASLPMLTVTDPVVSVAIGAFAFAEGIEIGKVAVPLEVLGLTLVVIGVFALGRSQARLATQDSPAASG
jgi:hypothetical protein